MPSTAREIGNDEYDNRDQGFGLTPTCWRNLSPGRFIPGPSTRAYPDVAGVDEREGLSPEEELLPEVLTLLIEDYEEKTIRHPASHPTNR